MEYLYFELTRKCNQRCVQCFNNSRHPLDGELETADVISVIDNFQDQGGKRIQVTGGDPLTRKDFPELIKHIGKCKFDHVILSTNGMLLKDSNLDLIDGIVDEVDISLDGFDETHDFMRGVRSFDLTVNTIQRTIERGIPTYVCCCLTPSTYARLDDFIAKLEDLGVSAVKFAQIGNVGRKETPTKMQDGCPSVSEQYNKIMQRALAHRGRIIIQQSHTTTYISPDVDKDGVVCDPCGRLYPLIGYLPKYWQIGSAFPHWKINNARLAEYYDICQASVQEGVRRIVEEKAVNWWTILHDALEQAAPTREYAK